MQKNVTMRVGAGAIAVGIFGVSQFLAPAHATSSESVSSVAATSSHVVAAKATSVSTSTGNARLVGGTPLDTLPGTGLSALPELYGLLGLGLLGVGSLSVVVHRRGVRA